jgi:hypothetical protein
MRGRARKAIPAEAEDKFAISGNADDGEGMLAWRPQGSRNQQVFPFAVSIDITASSSNRR